MSDLSLNLQITAAVVIFVSSLASFLISMFWTEKSRQQTVIGQEEIELLRTSVSPGLDHDHNTVHVRHIKYDTLSPVCSDHSNDYAHRHDHDHHCHHSLPESIRHHPANMLQLSFGASTCLILLKCFSAGIILGVSTMHLLADANETLTEQYPEYPLSFLFLSTGLLITLGIDQWILYSMAMNTYTQSCESESKAKEINWTQTKALVKAYMLEAGVAVHGIIMGFGYGTLNGTSNLPEMRILFIAYIFHQVFEGIGLGITMAETDLSFVTKVLFACVFALTLPIGIIIGIYSMNYTDNNQGSFVQGCANSLAAGSLLYIALVEMIAEDFHTVPKEKVH